MPASQQQIQQQLEALQQSYLVRLQQDWPQIVAMAGQLLDANDRGWQSIAKTLKQRFHTLAGSAGTFGMPQLGQQAKALEMELDSWLEIDVRPETELKQQFLQMVQELSNHSSSMPQAIPAPLFQAVDDEFTRKAHILVFSKDGELGKQLTSAMDPFGHQVVSCRTLEELKAAVAVQKPDVLVLDMPQSRLAGGLKKLLQQLLTNQHQPTVLFVVGEKESFNQYLAAVRLGASGYFSKPVDAAAIELRIQRLLALRQQARFRILIVDDDVMLAQHYQLIIEQAGMEAKVVNDPTKMLIGLQGFQPDVILLDVNMPDCTGPELAQIIRFKDEWLGVPIVYLSSETDSQRQLDALVKAGDDFISKPITDQALAVTVFARAQRARQLAEMMIRDSLTGLLQHATVKERLSDEIAKAKRSKQELIVVMLDLDHFKRVNDQYGHLVGDQVISSLANLLQQKLRKTDVIGRYGGEEFLLALPDCSLKKAKVIIDGIRQSFQAIPFSAQEQSFQCTFSAGLARVDTSQSTDENIDRADQALYQAKHNGRNRVELA
ncbi:diguanylate cyclase [Alkalimonas amylolytica]|uniref:diguanylate cyclase n=1 Tax=Alkalimonas amylolytica TaxID=152573 RepID=A0A1H4FM11_ALKAM|nr:diguanylate cyclase [Alkalimonas amylolytica]SEA97778.1 diguanylate cyclase (GGDEF) domain-containing protein [Alkalimonas amylolytica]